MVESTVKLKGGRPKAKYVDWLRTRAWLAYLRSALDCATSNALKDELEDLMSGEFEFPVVKYMNAEDFPDAKTRQRVGEIAGLKQASRVYDIGPEVDGENVPLWQLFEAGYTEFGEVIETGLTYSGKPSLGGDRIALIGQMFLPPEQWQAIRAQDAFTFEADNPVQRAADHGDFTPDLRTLAAAIACWRLSMLSDDGVAPMEYLLQCLLAGPFKPLLDEHLIHAQLTHLVKLLAVEHHGMQGNWDAADAAFAGLAT
ncbi:hypothetical protein [Burkholderia cenocepacia]|uniref:hypothetical protein n=1 Tax=Burkholderia cenocepacia TaxID=95486 RepID=UPI001C228292|nr:hypothetical protein [Burkholderia cenocepacia]MBU9658429.1 hypothetical protein [Burkholderia cenocepacia]